MEKNNRWDAILKRISKIDNPIGAEIGVYRGVNSMMLLKNHPGLKMFCVDQWSRDTYAGKNSDSVSDVFRELYQQQADFNYTKTIELLAPFADRTLIIRESSEKAALHFQATYFDFVFIDAAHDYESVKNDILTWMPKIKPGGYICGHDYDSFPGVRKVVEEILMTYVVEIDVDYTWFVRL